MSVDIATQMQDLYQRFGELPGIYIELHKELLAVRVENQQATATVFLQGAQLSHFQCKDTKPLIWCSDSCDFEEGHSLRGGVPLCWPWFGDLSRNSELIKKSVTAENPPAHGFVRNLPWQLVNIQRKGVDQTTLTLMLKIGADQKTLWPYNCELHLDISIGSELRHQLSVKNTDSKAFSFSNAFHNYYAVGSIDQVEIDGLDQHKYIDCTDNWSAHVQQGSIKIDREIDRIYYNGDKSNREIHIIDRAWRRVIKVTSTGNNSAVVWNPWIEKSSRLSNFDDRDYKRMVCVEIANTSPSFQDVLHSGYAISLEPQESHTMTTTVNTADL